MIFDPVDLTFYTTWTLIIAMGILSIVFIVLFFILAFAANKLPVVTGREGLIHAKGEVIQLDPLMVLVLGEIWEAKSKHSLKVGETIRVTHLQGLLLIVEPKKD